MKKMLLFLYAIEFLFRALTTRAYTQKKRKIKN